LLPIFEKRINVFAVEPNKKIFNILKKNISLNLIQENCTAYNCGLSDKECKMELKITKQSGLATFSSTPLRFKKNKVKDVEFVKVSTIDKKFSDFTGEIDLIKIDTEGWDYFVLKGGKQTFNKYRPIILMEFDEISMNQCGVTKKMILSFMQEIEFECYRLYNDIICFPNPIDVTYFSTFNSFWSGFSEYISMDSLINKDT